MTAGVRDAVTTRSAVYLAAQAVLGIAWWCVLAFAPDWRAPFELVAERHQVLDAFFLADGIVFIGGSALSAWALLAGRSWAPAAVTFTAGGTVYATLYLAQWLLVGGHGATGLAPMSVAAAITCAIAARVRRRS